MNSCVRDLCVQFFPLWCVSHGLSIIHTLTDTFYTVHHYYYMNSSACANGCMRRRRSSNNDDYLWILRLATCIPRHTRYLSLSMPVSIHRAPETNNDHSFFFSVPCLIVISAQKASLVSLFVWLCLCCQRRRRRGRMEMVCVCLWCSKKQGIRVCV